MLFDLRIFESMAISLLHIDWFVEQDISNKLDEIVDYSSIPLDFHVIGMKKNIVEDIVKYKPKYCCFQYDKNCVSEILEACEVLQANNIQCGISLCIGDEIDILERTKFDYVMVMNTVPGISGQKLNINKSLDYTNLIRNTHPNLPIHIDGGINDQIKQLYDGMNIRVFVCGSYLLKSENIYQNIFKLKQKEHLLNKFVQEYVKIGNNFKINKEASLYQIVDKLNYSKSGFLMITENNKLYGVVTDGDIRRKFVKPEAELINTKPIFCRPNDTMLQVYEKVLKTEKYIQFMPVVDNFNNLLGFIDLNKINGEINE